MVPGFNVSGIFEIRVELNIIFVHVFFLLKCPLKFPMWPNEPQGLVYFLFRNEVMDHGQNKGLKVITGWGWVNWNLRVPADPGDLRGFELKRLDTRQVWPRWEEDIDYLRSMWTPEEECLRKCCQPGNSWIYVFPCNYLKANSTFVKILDIYSFEILLSTFSSILLLNQSCLFILICFSINNTIFSGYGLKYNPLVAPIAIHFVIIRLRHLCQHI